MDDNQEDWLLPDDPLPVALLDHVRRLIPPFDEAVQDRGLEGAAIATLPAIYVHTLLSRITQLELRAAIQSVCVVHFDADGQQTYHVADKGEMRLYVVDDRAENDRIYEVTSRTSHQEMLDLLPDESGVGHGDDARGEALAACILARAEGRPHLRLVAGGGVQPQSAV